MRHTGRYLACLACALQLCSSEARAQFSPLPGVRGVVRVRNQPTPPEPIEVILLTNDGRPRDHALTDSLGNFQFIGLAPGAYIIVIDHPSYQRIEQRVEVIGGITRTLTQRNFTLEPRPARPESGSGLVSAERLRLPMEAQRAMEKSDREFARRNYAKAAEQLDEVLQLAPDFDEALQQRGMVALQMNQPDKARPYFEKALAQDPQNAEALIGLGTVLVRQGDAKSAVELLTRGLALTPKSYLGLFERCRANLNLQHWEAALADCDAAKENQDGVRAELLVLRGNLFLQMNRNPEALREFQGYLKLDSSSATADAVREMVNKMKKAGIKPAG